MLTAFHTIHGLVEPEISIQFETMYGPGAYTGEYAADATPTYTYDWNLTHRYAGREENPLLANRLAVLSLHTWADKVNGLAIRTRLREDWRFAPDVFSPTSSRRGKQVTTQQQCLDRGLCYRHPLDSLVWMLA